MSTIRASATISETDGLQLLKAIAAIRKVKLKGYQAGGPGRYQWEVVVDGVSYAVHRVETAVARATVRRIFGKNAESKFPQLQGQHSCTLNVSGASFRKMLAAVRRIAWKISLEKPWTVREEELAPNPADPTSLIPVSSQELCRCNLPVPLVTALEQAQRIDDAVPIPTIQEDGKRLGVATRTTPAEFIATVATAGAVKVGERLYVVGEVWMSLETAVNPEGETADFIVASSSTGPKPLVDLFDKYVKGSRFWRLLWMWPGRHERIDSSQQPEALVELLARHGM